MGREDAIAELRDAVARRPSLTLVEGEAGIGKTRLVRHVLDAASPSGGGPVLYGRSDQLREPSSLGTVLEALSGLADELPQRAMSPVVGALRPLLPELGEALPPAPGPLADSTAERHRALRGIIALLDAIDGAVLVLEDVQWADEASLELLDLLTRRQPQGLAIILTLRTEDCDPHRYVRLSRLGGTGGSSPARISLGPLDVGDVRRLAGAALGAAVPQEPFAASLHERTGGIPLVLEEVLRTLRQSESGRVELTQHPERMGVPAVLGAALQERLERVTSTSREAVKAASVLGLPRAPEVIAGILGNSVEATVAALDEAASVGLLSVDAAGGYTFRHPLAQQAVYEGVSEAERGSLHLGAARELSRLPRHPTVQIARHLRRAGESPAFVEAAEQAADEAARLGDDMVATSMLLEALATDGLSGAVRVRLARKLGRAALPSLAHELALEPVRAALEEPAASGTARGELRYWLGQFHYQSGEAAAGYEHMRAAVDDLEAPGRAARAMSAMGLPVVPQIHVAEHLAWSERALRAASEADDPTVHATVQVNHAMLQLECGDPGGWQLIEHAWRGDASLAEQREYARGCINVSQASLRLGYTDFAQRAFDRAQQLKEETAHGRLDALVEIVEAMLSWARGDWSGLEQRLQRLIEDPEMTRPAATDARALLGFVRCATGAVKEAEEHLIEAARSARAMGSFPLLAEVASVLANIDRTRGRAEHAVLRTAAALHDLRAKGMWTWAADLVPEHVQGLLATGALRSAQALVSEFEAGLGAADAPRPRAALALSRALVAAGEGAAVKCEECFEQSLQGFEQVARPLDRARVLEEWGRARCHRGEAAAASKPLSEALEGYRRLGAEREAARTRALMRAHGLRVPGANRRRPADGDTDPLTPREREVAGMAAGGMTNAEIAGALFLSVRTVEDHMSSVLRKLGLSSRRQLPVPGRAGAQPS